MRRLLFGITALIALFSMTFPVGARVNGQAAPRTFTVALETEPADLDPASSYDEFSNIPMRGVYEGLITLEGKSLDKFVPVLAERYDSQSDTVFTFTLRKGVKFHDNADLTADGVKLSLTRTAKAGLAASGILASFLTDPDKQISVKDATTLVITFARPQPFFLYALAASYGAWIISPNIIRSTPDPIKLNEFLQTHEAGSGPYQLDGGEMKAGQAVTLKRFEGYWRGWAGDHFDRVVIQTIPQSLERRRALEKGTTDAATSLLPDDLLKLQKTGQYLTNSDPTLRVDFLIMGAGYGKLTNPKARQAMSYAFDYEAYNRAELGKLGQRPNGAFPIDLLGSDSAAFRYTTDLKRAKQLMDEAGIAPGTTFTYATPEGRGDLAGQILRSQLEQIGYELVIKKLDSDEYYNTLFPGAAEAGRPDFMLQSWWPDYNSPLNYVFPIFSSKSVGAAGQNAGYYKDSKVDQIIEAALNAKTKEEVAALFKPFQDAITRDDPAGIYMAQAPDRTAVSVKIKGHVFNVLYLGTFDFYALSR